MLRMARLGATRLQHSAKNEIDALQGLITCQGLTVTQGLQVRAPTWLAQARLDVVLLHGIPLYAVNGGVEHIIVHIC